MVENNNSEFYTTSDIGIAAYLQLLGSKLVECSRLSSGKFFFKFEVDPQGFEP